jgi:peptide/nickel transport system substrate-binding protein
MGTISRRAVLAFTLAGALAIAGCSSDGGTTSDGGTDSTAAAGGVEVDKMVWAIQSPPGSMDIAKAGDVPTQRVQTAAFDRLLTTDNTGAVQPWVASKFENPDPLTWVFTLRDDVKFWDGTPLTSEDVAYSIARHTGDSASIQAFLFALVTDVEATDASTVTITLSAADPTLPAKLAIFAHIHQQKYDEEAGDALGGPDKPGMGTGPYSITSFSSADGATLTRNDDYWAGKPKVKTLEFKAIGDPDTARLAMSSGEIDGFFDVPLIATRQWDELDNATMTYVQGAYNDMLSMDTTRAPFDDVNVRTAMAHLIDRDGLLGPLFNNRATTAFTIVPAIQFSSSLGDDGAKQLYDGLTPFPEFSIDKAKEALAKSASPDGFSVDLAVDTTQPWMSPLAQNLAENAKQVGITVNVKQVSAADWGAGLSDPNASPLQLVALGAGTAWPNELPSFMLGTNGGFNIAKYGNPEIDALMDKANAAATLDELMPPLTDALQMTTDDLPYLPLFDEQVATSLSNKFVWEGGYSYWALGQAWPLQVGGAG